MAVIGWIVRVLLLTLIVRLIMGAFGGGVRRAPSARPGPPPSPAPGERVGGALKRDPQCGTYIPESRAIRASLGGQTQFFCSAACRDAYQAAH